MPTRFLPTGDAHRVTTLELLFDLVFVYAITAVSESITDRLTGRGLAEGLVMMGLIWFGWTAYAWLGNQARADEGPLRLAMFFAMAGYFVVALTIHEAFVDLPGGLPGPVVFVVAYAVIRLAHLVIYWFAADGDGDLRHTIQNALATTSVALVLLFVGAFLDTDMRLAVWILAVLVDYLGIFLSGARGWRVAAPGHFAERHALVMIIAIGESVVSVASAVSHSAIDWPLLGVGLLGVALAIALWRTYFNAIAVSVERGLREATGDDRTRLARDVFTYLHLPAVTGIVLVAVGLRVLIGDVADYGAWSSVDVPDVALFGLYGGGALYLASLSALRWRVRGEPSIPRLVVAGWLLVVGACMSFAPALPMANVAILAATFVGLVTFDAFHYGRITRDFRLGEVG
ncbi:low temperature requirement protein A [Nocardioides sp. CER19]|uniref:low temperature requirement protein A n=1 Tax=Nocardioides sp. CER19 TaxID=3038538 RepID=UPI00244BB4C9|nr:low temperature requirement protein A [Nocardioides sp. CER19]MDH2416464.1 low temperature requirement protein A [Nocardioides sp. CER19]